MAAESRYFRDIVIHAPELEQHNNNVCCPLNKYTRNCERYSFCLGSNFSQCFNVLDADVGYTFIFKGKTPI